jgi:hypothetical protein
MASYKMLVKDVIKQADVLLEIVDARFPQETRNSHVESDIIRLGKPFIIVLNKCDLVSRKSLERSKSSLSPVAPAVFISSKDRSGTTILRHKIMETAAINGIKDRDILVGCLGYPNVGKSSVINGVTGRHRASTSAISGHTKGVQFVNAGSHIKFIDTPGVIPFDEHDEYMQGLLAIKDSTHLKDTEGVALRIIEKMCAENKGALEAAYNITIGDQASSYGILELIGTQSNFLKKKGEIDEMRVSKKIIDDWQRGALVT